MVNYKKIGEYFMPYFKGKMTNPTTQKKEKVCVEAFNETPDHTLKIDNDGQSKFIDLEHPDAAEYPLDPFYVGEGEFSDGTSFELSSSDLPEGVGLVENEDDPMEDDNDEIF